MRARDRIRLKQLLREAEGYLELGMAEHALDLLDRLGDAAQANPYSWYLRGEALRELERYDQAIRPLRRAAKTAPDFPRSQPGASPPALSPPANPPPLVFSAPLRKERGRSGKRDGGSVRGLADWSRARGFCGRITV